MLPQAYQVFFFVYKYLHDEEKVNENRGEENGILRWVFSFGFSRNIAVSFPLALRFMMITNCIDIHMC